MGTFKVNGDISATGTMSASSFLGNASTSSIPLGFSYRETSWTWGTLTTANGYTLLTDWITPATGGLAFADKGTQVSCQIDGYFYQDEGRYIVLDANNYTSYAPTKTGSGASGTWKINITGSAATASSASSASLLSIHNTVTNTSTRSVAASSWTGSVSGLKYVWGEAFKDTSLGSDTGDLVLGLRAGQYTSGGTELCMMIDGDYYSMGNKVLHAGNYNNYAPTKTGTGASGTWGINITGSAGYATQADSVYGRYTGNGGNQIPSYIGANTTKFNMMRNFGSSDIGGYMDCILMNNYSWSDVPYATGLGITKTNGYPRAIIANGPKTGWAYTTELVTTYNYSWWCVPLSGGTMTGHLYATSGLSWNNSYWTPNGNIYCQPTGNGQEWSFDVGASGYTGCYWHVWSAKHGCSMLRCDADTNAVGIPSGPLYLGPSCYGPNLPGASYVGQIFFKT